MKWRPTTKQILISILTLQILAGSLFLTSQVYGDDIPLVFTGESHQIYFPVNNAIGFALDNSSWVLVTATLGFLNSSYNNIYMTISGGTFTFQPNQTVSMQITYSNTTVSNVRVDGSAYQNGTTYVFNTQQHQIEWAFMGWQYSEPLLPFGFIMGMVGLASMFGGSMWMVKKLRIMNGTKLLSPAS